MLSKADNELLTRVGSGTAMGELLRQYWLPVLLSSELPEPEGAPLRVRLLGEDLIAFRTTSGRVGLVAANCPHRGASLFFGRNEEDGLRCVYHGWKFDVAGSCVEMPNEPAESNFKQKVHHTAYPCRERNGMVWAYMGPLAEPPGLPELEWNLVPEDHRIISKRAQFCNWAQALEGGIDSSHASFLHSRLPSALGGAAMSRAALSLLSSDRHPHFEAVETAYGAHIGARRRVGEDRDYWRITEFLMPFYTLIPPFGDNPSYGGHAWVPADDETVITWSVTWHPTRPLTEREVATIQSGEGIHAGPRQLRPAISAPGGAWIPLASNDNDYLLDYEAQRTVRFTGIEGVWLQDQAMQESMGAIYDRSKEHLGTSDTGVIKARQLWLRSATALRERGVTPPGVLDPAAYRVRSVSAMLPRDANWHEATRSLFVARSGVNRDAP